MIARNLLPMPKYFEQRSRNVARVTVIEPTSNLSDLLSAGGIDRFRHWIANEQFRKEGYVLTAKKTSDGIKILVYSPTVAGHYYGDNTAQRLINLNNGEVSEFVIVDYPEFPIRGVMEGFYGIPWTWEQRKDVIEAMSQVGSNAFIFAAPDINRKITWREPLPDSYKANLEKLIQHAHQHHVIFIYEILPIFIDLNSTKDYNSLLERCKEAIELGANGIMIAFDDTNDYQGQHVRGAKAAFGQLTLMNNLRQAISDKTFLAFVPVEYYGIKPTPYLLTIGEELDTAIYVGWTGRKIRSQTVTVEDALQYGELIGRKPFLGHNFPVVDEVRKKRVLTIGPLMGLEPRLTKALSGIAFNFMELPYTSLVSGFTAADFAWNPDDYYASRSILNSARLHGKNLMELVELNPESYVDTDGVPDIAHILKYNRLKDLTPKDRERLREVFNTMISLDDLMVGIDPRIYSEIRPWLHQGNLVGGLGNLVLDGKIGEINWRAKGFAASKMVSGYRLGGLVFEDWILIEMGFPANLLRYTPLRLVDDFFETVKRARHKRRLH